MAILHGRWTAVMNQSNPHASLVTLLQLAIIRSNATYEICRHGLVWSTCVMQPGVGELAIAATTRLPFVALFGLESLAIVVHEMVLVAVSLFHHSNIDLGRGDAWLRWLLVTPAMHHVHHSQRLQETNSNYASVLSVWDRVCRSFYHPAKSANIDFGLDEFADARWHNIPAMLKMPFVREQHEVEND